MSDYISEHVIVWHSRDGLVMKENVERRPRPFLERPMGRRSNQPATGNYAENIDELIKSSRRTYSLEQVERGLREGSYQTILYHFYERET